MNIGYEQISIFDNEISTNRQLDIDIQKFKDREIKAKSIFHIQEISKATAYDLVKRYHYLGGAKFFAQKCYGLFHNESGELVGCATYSFPQGISALKGWFSLGNECKDVFELSRLCVLPNLNGTNATSFLLSGSINVMKKEKICRAVITLACSDRHVGSIYQVCNFKYYGLTDVKSDFYREDGAINARGETKNEKGVWIPRAPKHRYAYIIDNTLKCNYAEADKPTLNETTETECCHGSGIVYDKRFRNYYKCPKCNGEFHGLVRVK
jgi:hypothetical protein